MTIQKNRLGIEERLRRKAVSERRKLKNLKEIFKEAAETHRKEIH